MAKYESFLTVDRNWHDLANQKNNGSWMTENVGNWKIEKMLGLLLFCFILPVDSDGNHVHKRGSDISVEKEGEQPENK